MDEAGASWLEAAAGRVRGLAPAPSSWLLANADLVTPGGRALDVACGSGRHALVLAAAGLSVRAVDRDPRAIVALRSAAERLAADVEAAVVDLEAEAVDLGEARCDLVVVMRYLHRPLFPALARCLAPGGVLLYETFTIAQASRGRPGNPRFLLREGELPSLVAPLRVLRSREGEFDGQMVASIAARKA